MIYVIFLCFLGYVSPFLLYVGDPCIDKVSGETGECLPIEACPPAQTDLESDRQPSLCSKDKFPTIVCCRYEYGSASVDSEEIDSFRSHIVVSYKTLGDDHQTDYRSSFKGEFTLGDRISVKKCQELYPGPTMDQGDHDLKLEENEEFPHMAALGWILKDGSMTFKCSGALISDLFVLSAAHCMSELGDERLESHEPTFVRLGVKNITGDGPDKRPFDVPITEIVKHPKFKHPTKYYDIALLKLAKIVPMNSRLKPACLWSRSKIKKSQNAFITGWAMKIYEPIVPGVKPTKMKKKRKPKGKDKFPVLRKVNVNLLETSLCQKLLYYIYNRHWIGLQGHQMCAGIMNTNQHRELSSCRGDPGGPLQVRTRRLGDVVYHIVGVTSRDQCGMENKPGIFTRVSSFVPWIESVVWPFE